MISFNNIESEVRNTCKFQWTADVQHEISWVFWWYLFDKTNRWKLFEGKMFIRNLSTNFLKIVCEFLLNFKVIFISIIDPVGTCWDISKVQMRWPINNWECLSKLSSGSNIHLTTTWKVRTILQNVWRRVVGRVIMNTSPSNTF